MNSFNSQPPEGGWLPLSERVLAACLFQLTAARRRLVQLVQAAVVIGHRFNSQPPEGGWVHRSHIFPANQKFQLTAARRRLAGV